MTSVTSKNPPSWDTLMEANKEHKPVASNPESIRLQRANNLDRKTLAAIYDDFHLPIYRYIYRQVGDVETARDLTAEVFRRFLQAIQDKKGPTAYLSAWLYRVAHNIVIDHYRREQHRQHLPLDQDLLASSDNTGQAAENILMAEHVRLSLQHLTPDQQQVIILKFLEGLSNKEVAEITGKPVGAIKSLQHRALAALQRQLVQEKSGEDQ